MPLSESDIRLGVIAYFGINDLCTDSAIRRTGGSPDPKPRPFVCYAQDADGQVYWTPMTTDDGQTGRTTLDPTWIKGASGRLASERQMINDGAHTYAGLPERFAHHSHAFDRAVGAKHPQLASDGIAAALGAVASRGGLVPEPPTPSSSDGV